MPLIARQQRQLLATEVILKGQHFADKVHFRYIVNGLYIEYKELNWVYKQLAAFKRGELNIIEIEGPADKRVIKRVKRAVGEVV
jgi:hypothetical protein